MQVGSVPNNSAAEAPWFLHRGASLMHGAANFSSSVSSHSMRCFTFGQLNKLVSLMCAKQFIMWTISVGCTAEHRHSMG